ncbi:MAG: phenylalanine--tRNA ligase subunit beta [Salibacteraceae bacterium]
MNISYNWLQQYIHLEEKPDEIAELLTSSGLEVEGVKQVNIPDVDLSALITGKILSVRKHPNADRLVCTQVDVGREAPLNIVCGAPNVAEGQIVVVATVGTQLHMPDGQSITIRKAKIRGEESEGMICAEDEIGWSDNHDGIMVLPPGTPVGKPLDEVLNTERDVVFEIGLTPNRADAVSHYGVARDLKALLLHRKGRNTKLCKPSDAIQAPADQLQSIRVRVENEEACPRYCGITVQNIRVRNSPEWLQNRLIAIGVRPINNVVDITNYINHAFGQPLHAFDADKIEGNTIIVKTLPDGTKFTTLDKVERTLDASDLMICDANKGLALAGIFGGATSGVTEKTTRVFIEGAYFNPVWIRKSAKRHGLKTDASFRYERGIDPNLAPYATALAAKMMCELCDGEVASTLSDTRPEGFPGFEINFNPELVRSIAGTEISNKTIRSILESLEMEVCESKNGQSWQVTVPPYRVDVSRPADLVEEVLRIYNFDNIPVPDKLSASIPALKVGSEPRAEEAIRNMLVASGFYECMSNSMIDRRWLEVYPKNDEAIPIKIDNPLSEELSVMRPDLLYSMLTNAAYNLNRQQSNLKLFEYGNAYWIQDGQVFENKRLAVLVSGLEMGRHWRVAEIAADWYALRGVFEQVVTRLGIHTISEHPLKSYWSDYGLSWSAGQTVIASGGKVSEKLCRLAGIKKRDIFYLEFDWKAAVACRSSSIQVGELPKFPGVRRDLALVVDTDLRFEDLRNEAFNSCGKLLKSVSLFDVYEGKELPEGTKSYALALYFIDPDRTLTDEEVDKLMVKTLKSYEQKFNAKLR